MAAAGDPVKMKLLQTDAHRAETEYDFAVLSHYLEIVAASVVAAERAAKAEFDAGFEKIRKKSLRQFYAGTLLTHARRYREELPLRVGYGFLLQLYTILETRSGALCAEVAARRGNLPLKLEDLAGGRYMKGVLVFMKKLLRLSICDEGDLNRLRVLRNCIAHANGRVSDSENPKQVMRAARESNVRIDSEGYLEVGTEYCRSALETVRVFFDDVFTQLGLPRSEIAFARPAVRHGVSVMQRNGKWVCELIGEAEVEKLRRTKI